MLRRLRWHALMVGTTEVLADVVRYVASMLVVIILLGQLARLIVLRRRSKTWLAVQLPGSRR